MMKPRANYIHNTPNELVTSTILPVLSFLSFCHSQSVVYYCNSDTGLDVYIGVNITPFGREIMLKFDYFTIPFSSFSVKMSSVSRIDRVLYLFVLFCVFCLF